MRFMSDLSFIVDAAVDILQKWNLEGSVRAEEIARLVLEGTSYWEMSLPEGTHIALIRLFSPVVRREEIFLGNVLLNDFLNKALIRGVQQSYAGRISLLINDLENYYYLYFGSNTLDELTNLLRRMVDASLLDLYFADENFGLGIYGHFSRMLDFQLANREPFPIFSIPSSFIPALIDKVAVHFSSLDSDSLDVQRTIAALGFFFSRGKRRVEKFDKKKGIYVQRSVSEMQSDFAFLMGAAEDGIIPLKLLRDTFVLAEGEELNEQIYRDRKKKEVIDKEKFKEMVQLFICNIRSKIVEEDSSTVLASLHEKSLDIQVAELVNKLLHRVQLGFIVFQSSSSAVPCRFCGDNDGLIREKTIIAGTGMTKFFNPAPKMPHPKQAGRDSICIRCGVSSYLETKLLGVMFASDMPIPRPCNIIFHYGQHNDTEVSNLASLIDDIFELIKSFRRQVEENKAKGEKIAFSLDYIKNELNKRAKERQALMEPLPSAEEALNNLLSDEITESGVEVLGQIRPEVDTKIYAMGHSNYRLFIIILPQFEPLVRRRGGGAEIDWKFIPEHFSRSRIAMVTLLAILRKLCGCNGPYYFHSAPTLSPGGFDRDTFYINGKAESADEFIKRYGTIVNFARRLINSGKIAEGGKSPLIEWILLAEKFEEDPLGTFSDVLRHTPMKKRDFSKENRDKFSFKPLAKYDTIDEMGVTDGLEYLKLMECLKLIRS
jgi:hypothetical protein